MTVNWYDGGLPESPPCVALVSRKGSDSLCLHIIDYNNANFMIRDGCREMSDPKAKNDLRAGGWEPTAFTKLLIGLVKGELRDALHLAECENKECKDQAHTYRKP